MVSCCSRPVPMTETKTLACCKSAETSARDRDALHAWVLQFKQDRWRPSRGPLPISVLAGGISSRFPLPRLPLFRSRRLGLHIFAEECSTEAPDDQSRKHDPDHLQPRKEEEHHRAYQRRGHASEHQLDAEVRDFGRLSWFCLLRRVGSARFIRSRGSCSDSRHSGQNASSSVGSCIPQ